MERSNEVDSFDWREKNVLTKVRNQKKCGCCWAMAATGAIEFLVNTESTNANDELVELSPQHLLDYVVDDLSGVELDSAGCYGFYLTRAFNYAIEYGIAKENEYPFTAERRPVPVGPKPKPFLKISNHRRIDISELKKQVRQQPVAANMIICEKFFNLREEIYRGPEDLKILEEEEHHFVLVVGYGTDDNGEQYWIIKNSWGEGWGVRGYGRVSQNYWFTWLCIPEGIEYV